MTISITCTQLPFPFFSPILRLLFVLNTQNTSTSLVCKREARRILSNHDIDIIRECTFPLSRNISLFIYILFLNSSLTTIIIIICSNIHSTRLTSTHIITHAYNTDAEDQNTAFRSVFVRKFPQEIIGLPIQRRKNIMKRNGETEVSKEWWEK